MIQAIRKRMNQKGFTLVELMVVIAILGVLAAIAIPKFNESTAKANTARIQADLRTIDSASVQYQADNGKMPTGLSDLQPYMTTDLTKLAPPKGGAYELGDEVKAITATTYAVVGTGDNAGRGTLNSKVAEDYGYVKTTT